MNADIFQSFHNYQCLDLLVAQVLKTKCEEKFDFEKVNKDIVRSKKASKIEIQYIC